MDTKISTTKKSIKRYFNLYAFPLKMNFLNKNKNSWVNFVIPTKKKIANISNNIDKILYAK